MSEHVLQQVTPHVWWLPPTTPDRPALCAVVGERGCIMLDSGASDAHARHFLNELKAHHLPAPRFVVFSHWHWDHTFGAAEVGVPVIAHRLTAQKVTEMAGYSWDDAAMAERVAAGLGIPTEGGMSDIQQEVPGSPRRIRLAPVDIMFDDALTLDLGDITCEIRHVGGDHAADSCVMFVPQDGVLFLGDCLYYSIFPQRGYTPHKVLPLIDTLLAYETAHIIEGHHDTVQSRAEFMTYTDTLRLMANLAAAMPDADAEALAAAALAQGAAADDDEIPFLAAAFVAGRL